METEWRAKWAYIQTVSGHLCEEAMQLFVSAQIPAELSVKVHLKEVITLVDELKKQLEETKEE